MIQFLSKRSYWFTISAFLVGASLALMFIFGFNLGIDFTGGSLLEINFSSPPSSTELKSVLESIVVEKEPEVTKKIDNQESQKSAESKDEASAKESLIDLAP